MKKNNYIAYLENDTDIQQLYQFNKDMQWNTVQVTALAKQNVIVNILLSAKIVTVLTLTPPKKYEKYGKQLLLNLVENHIVEPIEEIELFLVEKQKKQLVVAIINKEKWQSLLTNIQENGWELGKVWIDALCLPIKKNNSSLFAINSQKVLWRSYNNQIFNGYFNILEQTQDFQDSNSQWITVQPAEISDSNYQLNAIKEVLSFTQTTKHNLNPKATDGKQIEKHKMPIITLALVTLTLWTTNLYLSNRHNQKTADTYYQGSVELFRQVFPEAKKIPTRSYLTQKLKTLADTDSSNQSKWIKWLELIARYIDTKHTEILSIDYYAQPPRMVIEIEAQNNEWVQKLTNQLSKTLIVNNIKNTQNNNMIQTTLEIKE